MLYSRQKKPTPRTRCQLGKGAESGDRRGRFRRRAAGGAVDAGGGAPFGQDFRLVAEAVARSAVRATGPTARPAQALAHLVEADLDAALPGFVFLGRGDPTDPLVPRQGREVQPQPRGVRIGFEGVSEVRRQFMDRAAGEFRSGHGSRRSCDH